MTIGLHAPPKFFDHRILQANEAAAMIGVPEPTVRGWLRLAEDCLCPLGKRDGTGRFLTGHEGFILSILAALRGAGVDVTAQRLCTVFRAARGELPRTPDLFDELRLPEYDYRGKPTACVVVDLSSVFLDFASKFEKWQAASGR